MLRIQAEGFDALAHDGRPAVRDKRSRHAKSALAVWQQLRARETEPERLAAIDERLAALDRLIAQAPAESTAIPLARFRLNMEGDVTLAQAIDYMRNALARVGYQFTVDKEGLQAAGVDFDKLYHPRLKAVTFDDLNRRFFRRAGVTMQRTDNVVRLVPMKTTQVEVK